MKLTALTLVASAAISLLIPTQLLAATAAYWRLEENVPVGGIVPDGPDTVLDSTANGNHMKTFSAFATPFTSPTYSSRVSPLPLRSGAPNTRSLDFGPMPEFGTDDGADADNGNALNDDIFTDLGKPIREQLFTAMTVELSFRMNTVGGFQALFGKDGKPLGDAPGEDDSPVPPLKVMVRGDDFPDAVPNQLFVEWIDGDGTLFDDIHFLASGETVIPDTWYHVAFTLTASNAELWVAGETGGYTLKDAISGADFVQESSGSVLVVDPTPMTIGRGMFGNGVTDWADAIIDEVRVSDAALTLDQFLFMTAAANNADFDGDSDVDGNDFLIWQRNVGRVGTGTHALGDANNDTNVNAADLAIWKTGFGNPIVAPVPEPVAFWLSAAGLVGMALRRLRN
jgi:hypothetical protein